MKTISLIKTDRSGKKDLKRSRRGSSTRQRRVGLVGGHEPIVSLDLTEIPILCPAIILAVGIDPSLGQSSALRTLLFLIQ